MNTTTLTYTLDVMQRLLAADSPTGFTRAAAEFCMKEFTALGYEPTLTGKGGVFCCLGGYAEDDGLLLSAHIDTLGAMVHSVKANGRLKMVGVGLNPNNIETETVRVYARDGRVWGGTVQLANASVHVNREYSEAKRTFENLEILLDENVSTPEEVSALGIGTGCFIAADPRTVITESGYIKSRYLDDKLSAAIILGLARHLKEEGIVPRRKIYVHFTVYEEIGHGAAGIMPHGVTEILGVDMGCVGEGITCTEKEVSICAKDGSGPYNYDMVCRLIDLAEKNGIGYAVDIYPYYSSDCSVAVKIYDVRHALIGPGVYASHGYERSHTDGVKNTFDLLEAYVKE
ncbi:MAG: M42 family metallopeptidase [Ruminococcaceae bacterium]|nr:M42 family metallopeptidase [Oscillospiraceae bacterium]